MSRFIILLICISMVIGQKNLNNGVKERGNIYDLRELQRQNQITQQILANFLERRLFPHKRPTQPIPSVNDIILPPRTLPPSTSSSATSQINRNQYRQLNYGTSSPSVDRQNHIRNLKNDLNSVRHLQHIEDDFNEPDTVEQNYSNNQYNNKNNNYHNNNYDQDTSQDFNNDQDYDDEDEDMNDEDDMSNNTSEQQQQQQSQYEQQQSQYEQQQSQYEQQQSYQQQYPNQLYIDQDILDNESLQSVESERFDSIYNVENQGRWSLGCFIYLIFLYINCLGVETFFPD